MVAAEQFEGGLAALIRAAKDPGAAVVAPLCETETIEFECRTVRLRHAGHYPSGHSHVTATMGDDTIRLAYTSHSGHYL